MTPAEAARIAFAKCKKSNDKNRACAGYVAKQLLIADGMTIAQAIDAVEEIGLMLDEWFQLRQTQPNFMPSDTPDVHTGDHQVDFTNVES